MWIRRLIALAMFALLVLPAIANATPADDMAELQRLQQLMQLLSQLLGSIRHVG
jgi:hypothetical protein